MQSDDIQPIAKWMLTDPFWHRYELTSESIETELRGALKGGDLLLVADLDLTARGFAWCIPNGMFGSHPYLKRFGVDPAFAGRRIGAHLLSAVEKRLLAESHTLLFLLVSDFNETAQRFYRRHGYSEIGALPDLAVPGVTELLFSKRLGVLA
jgi:ribosomal protein S18 acetylase RimI-like enzyme